MIIPSEFLRGREEGEVEIFAHDSFPTYFRQVKKLSTGKKLSASKKTFDLRYQPLACDIQHGSFYDRTFLSLGDGRPIPDNLSASRSSVWNGNPWGDEEERWHRAQPEVRRILHHLLCLSNKG